MEGKLAHHGVPHINKAMGGLFQQQSTAQVRVLYKKQHFQIRIFHHIFTWWFYLCVLMIDTQAYTFKIVNLQTVYLLIVQMSVCMYVEHMSQTIHFIGFRLGMCIFNAPKKCSVEFCANWTIGWTLIKKCINRQTALWSQWGAGLNRQPVDQVENVFLYSLSSPADSNWWPVGQNCPRSNNIWPTRSFW